MALAELRNLSATSYFRSGIGVLVGDPAFTASVLLRALGPTSATQWVCGNAGLAIGWSFVRLADTEGGAQHNYAFTVFENGVAQTLDIATTGSVGKMMLFHLVYTGTALIAYVNGIEINTAATAGDLYNIATDRFSIGYNLNAASEPNPDMGFVAFGYSSTAYTASQIAENTLAIIKSQEISSAGLPTGLTHIYSVARDSGSGVPSTLRNFGTYPLTQPLDVVGRTSMSLSSPPSFLGDSVKLPGAGVGDVSGPGASTNNAAVRWDGVTGTQVKDSVVIIDDGGNVVTPGTLNGISGISAVAPVNVTKAAAVVGVSTAAARADHKHDITTAAAVTITDSTNAEGSATSLARSDHTHAHGNLSGGTLHDEATGLVAGFMSAADKAKLDGIPTGGGLDGIDVRNATHVVVAGDKNRLQNFTAAGAVNLTINANVLSANDIVYWCTTGTGTMTVNGTATLRARGNLFSSNGQYSYGALIALSATEILVVGDRA